MNSGVAGEGEHEKLSHKVKATQHSDQRLVSIAWLDLGGH